MAAKDKKGLALVTAEAGDVRARFNELFDRANKTNAKPADAAALRAFLREHEAERLWERIAGCVALAENYALESLPVSAGIAEAWRFRLADLKGELAGEGASKIEWMLAQHAALCWLRLAVVELKYSQAFSQELSLTAGAYWEKRLTSVQRRFTKACEALERVRMMKRRGEQAGAGLGLARTG